MDERQQIGFAAAAFAAGAAWGALRHRRHVRRNALALLEGLEWFVAYGGAAIAIVRLREALEGGAEARGDRERVTRIRRIVTERSDGAD